MASILGGEDARLHEDFTRSMNTTATSSDQLRAAYTEHEALSKLKSYTESDNFSINSKLDQRLVNFLSKKYRDVGLVNDILDKESESAERYTLTMEFAKDFFPKHSINHDTKGSYNRYSNEIQTVSSDTFAHDKQALFSEGEQKIGHSFGEIQGKAEALKAQVELESRKYQESVDSDKHNTLDTFNSQKLSSETALKQSIGGHFWNNATSVNAGRAIYNGLFGSEKKPPQPSE